MASHGADTNEASNFPFTIPSQRETTLQIRMGPPLYHTLRYDFKPASINSEEPASLELTRTGEVTIKAPNIGGSISSQTVFRGQRRPHVKECLLVIDNSTGEMVLQKLTDNITVKATRSLGGGGGGGGGNGNGSNGSNGGNGGDRGGGSSNGGGGSNCTNATTNTSVTSNVISANLSNGAILPTTKNDGPQLSEESSSSSDSSSSSRSRTSSTSSSSSSSSSSNSGNSSPNNEGFTF